MKILFVWPRYTKDTGYKPFAISILSGISRNLGHQTSLFDAGKFDDDSIISYVKKKEDAGFFIPVQQENEKQKSTISLSEGIISKVSEYNPDIIAFSVMSGEHIIANKITSSIKKQFTNIPIVWGGVHPTVNPQECIESGADYVCIGEGLRAFRKFLITMEEKGTVKTGENIVSSKDSMVDFDLLKKNLLPIERDLDSLPYLDWTIFEESDFMKDFWGKRVRIGEHMTRWGCPNRCSYCINHFYQKMYGKNYKIRSYSPQRIVTEIQHLKNTFNIDVFRFLDDDFFIMSNNYLAEFSALYTKHVGIPYVANGFANSITEEKVRLLKHSGCVEIGIGVENGDEEYRKSVLSRNDSLIKVKSACDLLKKYDIKVTAFNLIGTPHYTRELHNKTIAINREISPDISNLFFFTPFPQTELRRISIEEGSYDSSKDNIMENYSFLTPSLEFKDLSEKDLMKMYNLFTLYVKMPKEVFKYIKYIEDNDVLGENMRRKLLSIYQREMKIKENGVQTDIEMSKEDFVELDEIMRETL